ncbi:hypothetical protein P4S73_02910 [Paraglaciecola sp. Hal342]
METNVPGIFAAGDCRSMPHNSSMSPRPPEAVPVLI